MGWYVPPSVICRTELNPEWDMAGRSGLAKICGVPVRFEVQVVINPFAASKTVPRPTISLLVGEGLDGGLRTAGQIAPKQLMVSRRLTSGGLARVGSLPVRTGLQSRLPGALEAVARGGP